MSVILATHNRRHLLERCLGALRHQTLEPSRFEVVVADDGSTDDTADMAEGFEAPFAIRVLRLAKASQPTAQNKALEAAVGAVAVILDDDTIPSPDLLAVHLAAHDRQGGGVLGIGRLSLAMPSWGGWYSRAVAQGWEEHYEELKGRPASWSDCYGANFSAPRAALIACGGFATELLTAQDLEIAFRLCGAGYKPTYLDRAAAVIDDHKRWPQMLADARRQGAGHVEFVDRHPATEDVLLNWKAGVTTAWELPLRRALVAARFPAAVLVRLGWLIPGEGRKMLWFHFLRRLAFWQSTRQCIGREAWHELTRPGQAVGGTEEKL